jgi:selenide,water dikinase
VGLENADDAGVYKLTDDLAIIQTLDYFTPIVDDPYTFGQIAVANALSDVYAMGGKPITAMNIVCFPVETMDISVLREILKGGLDKLREAEVVLLGGHSVDDSELKYGLSVTGVIHPQKIMTKGGAQAGDILVLTKPLGTGLISTAQKGELADEEAVNASVKYMTTLNKEASEAMMSVGVNACTDITGFGLLGHACEMAENSKVGMEIDFSSIPLLPQVEEFAKMGLVPAGTYRNKEFRSDMVEFAPTCPEWVSDVLFDPQTSGGLLISVFSEKVDELLVKCGREAVAIGRVTSEPKIRVK